MMKRPAPENMNWPPGTIFTVGHSTRTLEKFIALLQSYGIESLVDIRTVPRSRHNPQFNGDTLRKALKPHGIEYAPLRALGGLRHARQDSPNTGWRNTSFRGYADYMQTEEFAHALDQLIALSRQQCTAIMCAESVPWRCHRSLVADAPHRCHRNLLRHRLPRPQSHAVCPCRANIDHLSAGATDIALGSSTAPTVAECPGYLPRVERHLECAPNGGLELTRTAGLSEDESHGQTPLP
jgi:hypothetical protein